MKNRSSDTRSNLLALMWHTRVVFIIFVSVLVSSLLLSCTQGKLVDESAEVNPDGWTIDDSVVFGFVVNDTTMPVDFYLNIRNESSYRYSNLILFFDTRFPDGRQSRDTLECFLARPDGQWTGRGIGSRKEVSLLVKKNVIFPSSGAYRFVFRQAMRDNPLLGITDVGITIHKTDF